MSTNFLHTYDKHVFKPRGISLKTISYLNVQKKTFFHVYLR